MKYWLIDHPTIVWFRWSPSQSWGSTWPFLVTAIATYITAALTLHVILKIFKRLHAVPLGPIPAIHYLIMSLISATIFTGILLSAGAELRDTRPRFLLVLCFLPLSVSPFVSNVLCHSPSPETLIFPAVQQLYSLVNCQMILLGCNLVSHVGVLWLHLLRGGCNGIGAWIFNSVLNAAILFLFLKSYVNVHCKKKNNNTDSSTRLVHVTN
ncbi:hypothetical protein P8452_05911 [Trifolium repens]|nr:hypothetical protein P8452_05911 [Trifolium repens]